MEMRPPDWASAPPNPMAPAPMMLLVKLKIASPTDEPEDDDADDNERGGGGEETPISSKSQGEDDQSTVPFAGAEMAASWDTATTAEVPHNEDDVSGTGGRRGSESCPDVRSTIVSSSLLF